MTISFLRTRRRKALSVGVGNYVPILGSPYQQYRAFVHSRHIIVKGTEVRQSAHAGAGAPREQGAVASVVRGFCPLLRLQVASLPAVPGAHQGQGRKRGEVRQA